MQPYRSKLLTSAILAVCSYAVTVPGAAIAQEEFDESIEEIIISGTRTDFREALEVKRASDIVMDSIVSSDIGKNPDQNIVDSLSRVTGVQVFGQRGQTESISIRGLSSGFTQTMLNGRVMSTAFGVGISSRGFEGYIVPSAFTSRLDVRKSSTADVQEGGLAGTVDVITHRAFNSGERSIFLNATGNHDSNNGEIGTDFVALYSDVFAKKTLGVTFGANIVREEQGVHRSRGSSYSNLRDEKTNFDYNGDGDTIDENIIVRNNVVLEDYNQERDRNSFLANIEWRPADWFSLFGEILHSAQETTSPRLSIIFSNFHNRGFIIPEDAMTTLVRTKDGVERELVTQIHNDGVRGVSENELQIRDAELTVAQLTAKFYEDEPWSFEVGFTHSESTQKQDRFRARARQDGLDLIARYDLNDSPAELTLLGTSADDILDPSLYSHFSFTSGPGFNIDNKVEQTDFQLDVTRAFDSKFFSSAKFGVSYSAGHFDSTRQSLSLSSSELAAIGIDTFNMITVRPDSGSYLDSSSANQIAAFLVPDVMDILARAGGKAGLIAADGGFVDKVLNEAVDIDEEFKSAYFMLGFDNNHRLSGNIGVRYSRTDEETIGNSIDLDSGFSRDSAGDLIPNRIGAVDRSRSYSEVLPSLNVRYNLTDTQVLRFAASRTMTRPNPDQLDLVVNGLRSGNPGEDNEISFSDPDLDPFLSDNIDLTYNWYFADASVFGIGVFHKDLKSLIGEDVFTTGLNVTDETTGAMTLENFVVTTDSNVNGVTLKGAELAWVQAFTNLPGQLANTGIKFNYTYIDNSDPLRLRAASQDNYNIILFYDNGKLDFRTSYTFRDEYLRSPAASDHELPESFGERGNLNANLTYSFTDNIRVRLSGRNLTDEADYRFHGPTVRQYIDAGRRISLSMQAKF